MEMATVMVTVMETEMVLQEELAVGDMISNLVCLWEERVQLQLSILVSFAITGLYKDFYVID